MYTRNQQTKIKQKYTRAVKHPDAARDANNSRGLDKFYTGHGSPTANNINKGILSPAHTYFVKGFADACMQSKT